MADREPRDLPKLPAPLGVEELLDQPEPVEEWIAEELVPANANVIVAGYPKSHKTNATLELGLTAAAAVPFLGRYKVPKPRRVGFVLMEGAMHRLRRRMIRIADGHGFTMADVHERAFFWFRPPLRLTDPVAMGELEDWVAELDLDLLAIDAWAYVSTGDSNAADEVTPQLQRLSALRDSRPGLTVLLVHHARKTLQDRGAERLTDLIRNSSAFGAWFDAGFVLSRADETAPVKVRAELRDFPSPKPFAFTVEDEHPAGPDFGPQPGGWLRLRASDHTPETLERRSQAERLIPAVVEFLRENPGCSKRKLRNGIPETDNRLVEAAFDRLCEMDAARYEPPEKRGQAGRCHLEDGTVLDRAGTVLEAREGGGVLHRAGRAPFRARPRQHTPTAGDEGENSTARSGYPCAGCGEHSFPQPDVLCRGCREGEGAS